MKDKLSGARFRWLNEKLYTTEGNEAYTLFQEKPELFDEVSSTMLGRDRGVSNLCSCSITKGLDIKSNPGL